MEVFPAVSSVEKLCEEIAEGICVVVNDKEAENHEAALRLPYDRKFDLAKDKFSIDRNAILGSGAFGIVYKGKIEGNADYVAIKTTEPRCTVENLKGLLSEIKLMIYIGKHEDIVGLVAAYTGQLRDGEVYLASEYCSKGSLEKLLRSSGSKSNIGGDHRCVNEPRIISRYDDRGNHPTALSFINLIWWCYQIANGMAYLASKKVIHADLATRNVLLTEQGEAKLSGFYLSSKLFECTNYEEMKEEPLPWRWMSIESVKQLSFSTQSDVWSYGVTLWEMFSLGDIPYPNLAWDIDFVKKLSRGFRLEKPKDATLEIYTQMLKCWNKDPEGRPTFTELADYFFHLKRRTMINGIWCCEELVIYGALADADSIYQKI